MPNSRISLFPTNISYNYEQVYADMIESGKNNEAAWGNQIGYILLRFHLAMCDDPLAYVRKAKKTMDRKKNSLEVAFTHKMCEFFLNTFGLKVYLLPICIFQTLYLVIVHVCNCPT
jgi:hypothetical protein